MLFAKGYIPDLDTDKDVVQEVFLSLIESQETFNDVDNLKAYLYGTVRHKCLKYLRHEEVKRRYQKYMQSEAPDETKTYEERVLEEEVYALLIKAIQNLPEQCQKVYLLVLEGKSNQEIAYQLQLNIETVKSHKQVGKKLLYDRAEVKSLLDDFKSIGRMVVMALVTLSLFCLPKATTCTSSNFCSSGFKRIFTFVFPLGSTIDVL